MYRRPTGVIIDLDNVVHNFKEVCRLAGPGSPVAPVVKSDAYGHGSIEVSQILLEAGAQSLAVSLTEEGLELRKAGIGIPILVLGGSYPAQAREIVEKRLTPVVSTSSMATALQEAGQSIQSQVKIHIKVETGLGRMGIPREETLPFVQSLVNNSSILVEGICTSFSSIEDMDFSMEQFRDFEALARKAEKVYGKPLLCHIAHTGGLLRGLTRPGWLVRPGIMLCGYTRGIDAPHVHLKPALTWRTEVFKVQTYPVGYRIGYSGMYKTKQGSRIALLPVGYTDGLRRSYMGRGEVLIHGRRAPLVGRFSMDWVTVEVAHIPEVQTGDEVILLGVQGDDRISADEMAERTGTIIDEVFVSIGKRVPRTYRNGEIKKQGSSPKELAGSQGFKGPGI
jgi:alanine racemase